MEFISKIGSAAAPFIVDLGGSLDPGLPPLVFGCVMLLSSVSFLFLPETRGKPLPQTIKEVEEVNGDTLLSTFKKKIVSRK